MEFPGTMVAAKAQLQNRGVSLLRITLAILTAKLKIEIRGRIQ